MKLSKLSKQRLEAVSDGIIAIIITIMVLNIPLPAAFDLKSIWELLGTISIYFVSFIVVGSFWTQHNRIFSYIETITNKVVWINLLYLFFLSLIPLFTKWVMENPQHIVPVICFDVTYLVINISYMFIFHFVVQNSEYEEIKKMRDKRNRRQEQSPKLSWVRFVVTVAIIAVVVSLSIYFSHFSVYFLLGLPVVSSVLNLLFDGNKQYNTLEKAV